MKKISIIVVLLFGQFISLQLMPQTLDKTVVKHKLSLIVDSIETYQQKDEDQKVLSVCQNGISLLYENNLSQTSAFSALCLQAGESCVKLKDYYNAKFYFYNSFILDELGKFDIGTYTTIMKLAEGDANIRSFKKLLDIAKSDTVCLNMLAIEPDELAHNLNKVAIEHFDKGDYSSALEFFEMEIALLDALGKTGNDDYFSIINLEFTCYKELGNLDFAKYHAENYITLVKFFDSENSIQYAYALQRKANIELELGNNIEAIKLYKEALSLIESLKGQNNMDYILCLENLGIAYQLRDNNPNKCLEIELEIEELLATAADATVKYKAHNLNMLSNSFMQIGDNEKALVYAERAVDLLEANGQVDGEDYASCLNTLTLNLIKNNCYDKAIDIGEKTVQTFSNLNRKVFLDGLRLSISNLSRAYFESGDIEKAISVLSPLLSPEYPDDEYKLSEIEQMVTYYERSGLKALEKELCEVGLRLAEKIGGKKSKLYAGALFFASGVQEKKGDEILMLQEAADIYLQLYGENNEDYLRVKYKLARLGPREQLINKLNSISDDYIKLYGTNSRKYFETYEAYLYTTANQLKEERNIEELLILITQIDSLSQKIAASFSKKDDLYLWVRLNLAKSNIDYYTITGNFLFYSRGVEIQTEVLSLAASLYGEYNIKYIEQILNLAQIKSAICERYYFEHQEEVEKICKLYYFSEQDGATEAWKIYESSEINKYYEEIRGLLAQVINYYVSNGDQESINYATVCNRLADCYYTETKYFPTNDLVYKMPLRYNYPNDIVKCKLEEKQKKAEELYEKSIAIYKRINDFESASYALMDLFFLYESMEVDAKSANALCESFRFWKLNTLQEMSIMTSDEKNKMAYDKYWLSVVDTYCGKIYHKIKDSISSKYAELSYDVQLLRKGLLLESEICLRDLILNSGDSAIISKYNRLSEIRTLLSNASEHRIIEDLRKEYLKIERLLLKESELYGNYLQNLSYTYTDVRSSLTENDVAIEFATTFSLDYDESKDFHYVMEYFALVLKRDYSSPKFIRLGRKFTPDSVFQQVWKPLLSEIEGMENVYFSPTYDLNILSLESAVLPDGSYISDSGINFYRVSSTREIIKQRQESRYKSATLYGGLEYNATIEDLVSSDSEERSNGLRGISSLDNDIQNDIRHGNIKWKYLPGTKIEVNEIDKIATSQRVKTKLYVASQGTESTFKNLSGKNIDIIHIATHGFYVKPLKNQLQENQMERSGLAFAGANHVQAGTTVPEGVDDGILTADEISRLDFRGIDLIVLSACETGLGDISGEGVYGLQRGFKKAGANSILMSLWKVDDEATMMLMSEFYKHLLCGDSKIEALKKAQRYVREQDGFEDPYYWAGFILLDGIN